MIGLCIATTAGVSRLAVAAFTLAWSHSVEKVEWQEDWIVAEDRLILAESRVKGSVSTTSPTKRCNRPGSWLNSSSFQMGACSQAPRSSAGSRETLRWSGWLADRHCAVHLSEASPRLRQDLVIALLTDRLVSGPWSGRVSVADLRAEAARLTYTLDGDRDVAELADLVRRATA